MIGCDQEKESCGLGNMMARSCRASDICLVLSKES